MEASLRVWDSSKYLRLEGNFCFILENHFLSHFTEGKTEEKRTSANGYLQGQGDPQSPDQLVNNPHHPALIPVSSANHFWWHSSSRQGKVCFTFQRGDLYSKEPNSSSLLRCGISRGLNLSWVKTIGEDFPMVQWLRIRLPMQETRVPSLVQKDPMSLGAAGTCVPQLLSLYATITEARAPGACDCNKRSHCIEKPSNHN